MGILWVRDADLRMGVGVWCILLVHRRLMIWRNLYRGGFRELKEKSPGGSRCMLCMHVRRAASLTCICITQPS